MLDRIVDGSAPRNLYGRYVAAVHTASYVSAGVWPLVHRRSFERLAGPKTDFWLAHAVGATVEGTGVGLGQAAFRDRPGARELRTVTPGSTAGLALIDLIFVARRRISSIYLADAAAETALLIAWGKSPSQLALVHRLRPAGLCKPTHCRIP